MLRSQRFQVHLSLCLGTCTNRAVEVQLRMLVSNILWLLRRFSVALSAPLWLSCLDCCCYLRKIQKVAHFQPHPITLHPIWSPALTTLCFCRIGGFTSGWENNAVSVYREYYVCYNQSPGNTAFPCAALLCDTAGNAVRADPVGGRSHALIWSLQTVATARRCLTSPEGWERFCCTRPFVWMCLHSVYVSLFSVLCEVFLDLLHWSIFASL